MAQCGRERVERVCGERCEVDLDLGNLGSCDRFANDLCKGAFMRRRTAAARLDCLHRLGVQACRRLGVPPPLWPRLQACRRVGVPPPLWPRLQACRRVGVRHCRRAGVWACATAGVQACGRAPWRQSCQGKRASGSGSTRSRIVTRMGLLATMRRRRPITPMPVNRATRSRCVW